MLLTTVFYEIIGIVMHSTSKNVNYFRLGNLARISLICGALALSACAGLSEALKESQATAIAKETPARISVIDQTITTDIAAVLTQIYDPLTTTVQINISNKDPILEHLVKAFGRKGFGIQRVRADQGANYISYKRSENNSDTIPKVSFAVTVGAVSVAREYIVQKTNVVAPNSTFRLSGTRAPVTVKDVANARKQVTNPSLSQAQYVAALDLEDQAAPIISLLTTDLVQQVASRSSNGPSLQGLNSSQIEVSNLFYGDQSSFASVLDDYEKVHKQVIVFGNDSMVLGDVNKSLIDQFVDNDLENDDVISLVGCSNGPTTLAIGNEGLALGRAQRVTEALMARGIARDKILDEGCWAPVDAEDRFPSRGVVLELWREAA